VETVRLADGDIAWVFPQLDDPAQVLGVLSAADAHMRRLADHLGVRPSWTGSGLEFYRLATATDRFGCAETRDISFAAELDSGILGPEPRREGGPPWEVSAEIAVRCDAQVDCGMHAIEEWPASRHDSPLEAAPAHFFLARPRPPQRPQLSTPSRDGQPGNGWRREA